LRCIFCKSANGPFTTREHILPESLGGGDWALLPDGLFCDACQNRFGSQIEQQALGDYPFSLLRIFLGIPTKKGKVPWTSTWEGTIRASPKPGTIGYDPVPKFSLALDEGRKTQLRLLAHPIHPDMTCRTLLKMGIEVVANDDPDDVFETRYDAARDYALTGRKTGKWWYLQREDMQAAARLVTQGVKAAEWTEGVRLSVSVVGDGSEVFHLKLLYLDLMVPLEQRIQPPDLLDLPEPEYRLFSI